jgi:hypothetical protein
MHYQKRTTESLCGPEPPGEFLSTGENIAEKLQAYPDAVSTEDKEAYKDFVLGFSPPELTAAQISISEKVFPEDWKAYLAFHFGETA